jgi:CDP-glycerol glycerophosphotransferase (TagB/SpsB family)
MSMQTEREPLFANGRPTIVYNPHHRPGTTSWTEMGEAVLDRFARGSDYNLVFAPHIRMFDPPRRYRARFRKYERLDHMRVDLGSPSSIDMSYTLGADIYLGDISSQVLEFIARPRPAIFLNPRGLAWRGDHDFVNWQLGLVVEDMQGLERALATRDIWQPDYEPLQRQAFAAAFPATEEPAPVLGARAIADFLAQGRVGLSA